MPYIRSLTSIRGYCAMLIVFGHYHFFIEKIPLIPFQQILRYATNVVDIFFILSGFFLTYIYREKFLSLKNTKQNLLPFWWYRFGRIYPLHLITLLFCGGLALLGWTVDTGTHLASNNENETLPFFFVNLFMFHGWGILPNEETGSFNHPSWSLSIEVFIYIVFPLLALLCFKIRNIIINLSVIAGIYFYLHLTVIDRGVIENPHGEAVYTLVLWKDDIIRGLVLFITGVALCNLHSKQFLKRLPWGIIAVFASIFAIYLMLHDVRMNYIILLSPLMIYALSHLSEKEERIFSNRPMFYLGEISYSIYMWHIPYALVVHHYYPLNTPALWEWVWIPLILGLIAISALSYHLIENPCRLWCKRYGEPSEKRAGES